MTGCDMCPVIFIFMPENYSAGCKCNIFARKIGIMHNKTTVTLGSFSLTGSDDSYYYSDCSFVRGWNMFANINPVSGNSAAKILRTTVVPESTLFWRLAESYVYE